MLSTEDSHELEHRDEGHDRWLVMQSAYVDYRRATHALECTHGSSEELTASERMQMMIMEGQQRVTFERYLEARMGFLEFHCDEIRRSAAGLYDPNGTALARGEEDLRTHSWWPLGRFRPVLEILAVALLCTTAFSLVREQRHVRDLEAAGDELRGALKQTRDGLQLLDQKMDSVGDRQHSPIQRATNTQSQASRRTAAAIRHLAVRKTSSEAQARRSPGSPVQQRQASPSWISTLATQRSIAPKPRSFSLSSSLPSTKLGPVEISLRSVNARRNTVSLSVVSGSFRLDLPDLKPHEPVSINRGAQQQRLELIIDRIDRNRLEGHLVEHPQNNSELKASRIKPEFQMNPLRSDALQPPKAQ